MVDRPLRYPISATDGASAVFDKVARSSKTAHKSMQGDIDTSAGKVKQLTQVLDKLADDAEADITNTAQAVKRLETVLGDELSFSARDAFAALERGGLEAKDVLDATEDEVRQLAAQLERLDGVAKTAGDSVAGSGRHAADGLDQVHASGDQTRSVLANMVGNSTQDLGQLGGVAGSAGVLVGQLGEYAADGSISLAGLAKFAGPMAILAVGVGLVTSSFTRNAEAARKAKEDTKEYADALEEGAEAADKLLAQDFVDDDRIRALQDAGVNLRVLADAAREGGDELAILSTTQQGTGLAFQDGILTAAEYADLLEQLGLTASPLTDELGKLADGTDGSAERFLDGADALAYYSDRLADGATEVEARREVEEAFGITIEETGNRATTAAPNLDVFAAATGRAADAASEAANELSRANEELGDLLDISDSLPVIADNLRNALRDAAEEAAGLAEANATGEDRYSAFLDVISGGAGQVDDYITALRESGVSAEDAAAMANTYIDQIFDLGGEFGVTRDEAEELRRQLGLDYPTVTARVDAVELANASAWYAELIRQAALLEEMQATIRARNIAFIEQSGLDPSLFIRRAASGSIPVLDDGGVIPGRAGDPVPMIGHAGEIVLNAGQQQDAAAAITGGGGGDWMRLEAAIARQTRALVDALSGSRRKSITGSEGGW